MPSPFPGMDPYLERSSLWPSAHSFLVPALARALNRGLPPTYFAKPNERVYVVDDDRPTSHDGVVLHDPFTAGSPAAPIAATVADPPLILVADPHEVVEPFVEIVRADGSGRIVATLEILSPRNKAAGHEGRDAYLRKQKEVLDSPAHLVEIDLLRQGPHTVAAPESWLSRHGAWHYVVCLRRAGERNRFEAWTATVRDRLPRFHVPLDPEDAPVVVDLQELLNACYDDGVFSRQIDYSSAPPPPPFNRHAQEWVDALLRQDVH